MQCHICGTETAQPDQKFCMECGARLAVATDATGEVPTTATPTTSPAHRMFDPITGQLLAVPQSPLPPPQLPPPTAASDEDATTVMPAFTERNLPERTNFGPPPATPTPWGATQRPQASPPVQATYDPTGYVPASYQPYSSGEYAPEPGWGWDTDEAAETPPVKRGFRLKPLFVLAILAGGLTVATTLRTVIAGPQDALGNTGFRVNDFGTNLMIAGVLLAVTMVAGAFAWCFGFRWGAGLAGGAGIGIAGWVALVLAAAEAFQGLPGFARELGYWLLVGAAGAGVLITFVSLRSAGDDGRAGLDPWVAALGAIASVVAFVGPLIPLNGARIDLNWTSPPGADTPTLYFVGRLINIGLILVTGVFGFLLVRRYGLGLAIGGLIGIGWLTLTSALGWTDNPVGPAFGNPGADGPEPYIVTTAGVALMAFFALVATAMAIIDSD